MDVAASTGSFTYDANGNLTAQGTRAYEWDAANQLVRVADGTTDLARFVYDGYGRRAQKVTATTRSYVYDGPDILQERVGSATTRTVHGPGIDQPLAAIDAAGAVSYYVADHLGSVVQQTTAAGAVTLTRQYDPYGVLVQGASASGYAFTGHEWDSETGLYHYRARYYSSDIGRFLSNDQIGLAGGVNLYSYVANNPAGRRDPYGNDWYSATKSFVKGVVGGAAGTVAVAAGSAAGATVGAVVAVGAVGAGSYQTTITVQRVVLGIDPYTGRSLTKDERIDSIAGLLGSLAGGGLAYKGREITIGKDFRIAPFGNRTGNQFGELPHYHRRGLDPTGQTLPGQGIGRHRPWETKSPDKNWCDRW